MIIDFSVENWSSYGEEATLSMQATKERNHRERVAKVSSSLSVLPVAAIFGANAAGKSNLVSALSALRGLVTKAQPDLSDISGRHFAFESVFAKRPTKFEIEFLTEGFKYNYQVAIHEGLVVQEKLERGIGKLSLVFARKGSEVIWGPKFKGLGHELDELSLEQLRPNQLLLNLSGCQSVSALAAPVSWLTNSLLILPPPASQARTPEGLLKSLDAAALTSLTSIDFGSLGFDIKTISLDPAIAEVFTKLQSDIYEQLSPALSELTQKLSALQLGISSELSEDLVALRDSAKKVSEQWSRPEPDASELTVTRESLAGDEVSLSIQSESDGTKRALALLPVFQKLMQEGMELTVVIDELDSSLHSLASRALISRFLASLNSDSRRQLIFTTHDTDLLTTSLFRRDEIWLVDKSKRTMQSELYAVMEFEGVRYDHDLRKMYLSGRFGAVPDLMAV
ncbi:ATP/GTP-binding protein [Candidatus Aquiluna sp. UB-MaderosW2red]|uniref:AAA family ATPase n=1 Tax=Candidatus Aquiluna sp. UB-MaderosW2red TaxID=1855377 RepID=UPI000875ED69|nr:ATP-binding protein [Candidatus Aquiluna sp. UB-MaderosW2red]SCX13512.1 hypothetical protein SAMN05216534_1404 [Candidatus Aquiluna sp. UB-MaderosW2red]